MTEKFTTDQMCTAIRQSLEAFGQIYEESGKCAYYTDFGWAGACLSFHLAQLESEASEKITEPVYEDVSTWHEPDDGVYGGSHAVLGKRNTGEFCVCYRAEREYGGFDWFALPDSSMVHIVKWIELPRR